jgi:uncharacterized protein HemX
LSNWTKPEDARVRGGNGKATEDGLPLPDRPIKVDPRLTRLLWTILGILATGAGLWFGLVDRVNANERDVRTVQAQVAKVQDTAQTKEAAAADMRVVTAEIRAMRELMEEKFKALDRRLDEREERRRGR